MSDSSHETAPRTLLIACGALAHELVALQRANAWNHLDIRCLPAHWHNHPERIRPGIEALLDEYASQYERILIGYGDCGTGGQLDALLKERNIERLPGPHCYSFFSGSVQFDALAYDEIGTFWLTDYITDHFDRLILDDLGINKHPELMDMYFRHYTRMVWLSQQPTPEREVAAQRAAQALSLPLHIHHTGLAPLQTALQAIRIVAA